MRRRPNPWITIPSLLTGLLGGTLGWMVTSVTCGQEGRSCTVWAAFFAVISFVAVTIGVALARLVRSSAFRR